MRILLRIIPFHLMVMALLFISPGAVSAHEMPVGGSRWCFGTDRLTANIEPGSVLIADIKGMNEGSAGLESVPDRKLQQLMPF